MGRGTSVAVQWLRRHLPMRRLWVQALVKELRSHMPLSKEIKRETEAVL